MRINKKKILKYTSVTLFFCTVLFWSKIIDQNDNNSLIAMQYDDIIQQYEFVKTAEQSDLKDVFLEIIDRRLKCYSDTSDYSLRLSTCRKDYDYEILIAARENLKSSPSLGEFMLCTQNCPLSYSFCNGEELSEGESKDCREIEVLCIETCLNAFWRGNSLSDTN